MDNSKALVRAAGGDKWELPFSQIPAVGEFLRIDGRVYKVKHVIHVPHPPPDGYIAELSVVIN